LSQISFLQFVLLDRVGNGSGRWRAEYRL